MIKNIKSDKLKRRIIALGVLVALTVVLLPNVQLADSADGVSLTGIEILKTRIAEHNPYQILEIVPDNGTGSIGYYIPQNEPILDIVNERDFAILENTADREAAIEAVKDNLEGLNILSDTEDTPLTGEGAYSEYLPWDMSRPQDSVALEFRDILGLTRFETSEVKGQFVPLEGGPFELVEAFEIPEDTAEATHYQDFDALQHINYEEFYYGLSFGELNMTAMFADPLTALPKTVVAAGTVTDANTQIAIDTLDATLGRPVSGTLLFKAVIDDKGTVNEADDVLTHYEAIGKVGEGFVFDPEQKYYGIDAITDVSANYSENTPYLAEVNMSELNLDVDAPNSVVKFLPTTAIPEQEALFIEREYDGNKVFAIADVSNGETATHYQNFSNLKFQAEAPDPIVYPYDTYYYGAEFSKVDTSILDGLTTEEEMEQALTDEGIFGRLIFSAIVDDNGTVGDVSDDRITNYIAEGTVGEAGFIFVDGVDYYQISSFTPPSTIYTENTPFLAQHSVTEGVSEFKQTPDSTIVPEWTSRFKSIEGSHTFVGDGNGSFNLDTTVDETVVIRYNHIYVELGFENNNWFHTKVLDFKTDDMAGMDGFPVEVHSVTPKEVTQELIDSAHLVYFSAGFDAFNTALAENADVLGKYTAENDISEDIELALNAKISTSPVIIDARLNDANVAAANLKDIISAYATDLYVDGTEGYAAGNLFVYSPFANGGENFAEPTFDSAYQTDLYNPSEDPETSPYNLVYSQIVSENEYRELSDVAVLDIHVSNATVLRYIINSTDALVENKKETLNVLEIQPINEGGELTTGENAEDDSERITPEIVISWLPENIVGDGEGQLNVDDIVISSMAVTEFIGKIEDINEVYDIVYIGASNAGFNLLENGNPNYNDNNMDGLYYTNVGDTFSYRNIFVGFLDREYNTTLTFAAGTYKLFSGAHSALTNTATLNYLQARTPEINKARFSAFDLTPTKYEEIVNFANSNFPVVVSDKLVSGGNGLIENKDIAVNIESKASADGLNTVLSVTSPTKDEVTPFTLRYQWYVGDAPIDGAVSSTYTPETAGNYHCEVTLSGLPNGETDVADSNTISMSYDSALDTLDDYENAALQDLLENRGGYFYPVTNVVSENGQKFTAELNFEVPADATVTYNWYNDSSSITNDSVPFSNDGLEPGTRRIYNGLTLSDNKQSITVDYDIYNYSAAYGYMSSATINYADGTEETFYSKREGLWDYLDSNRNGFFRASGWEEIDGVQNNFIGLELSRYVVDMNSTTSGSFKVEPQADDKNIDVTYQWYKDGVAIAGANTNEYIPTELGLYACVISDSDKTSAMATNHVNNIDFATTYYDVAYFRFVETVVDNGSTGGGETVTVVPSTSSINSQTVDNSSFMYETLNEIRERDNFFSLSELTMDDTLLEEEKVPITASQQNLLKFVNLSKPLILFDETADDGGKPEEYLGIGQINTTIVENQTVSYTFEIDNPTDPTPASSLYEVELFIDLNADGRHSDDESLSDLYITETDTGKQVESGELRETVTYTVERILPSDYLGAIPWRLQISKVVPDGATTSVNSEQGITYIKPPQLTEIRVLQVLDSAAGVPLDEDTTYRSSANSGVLDEIQNAGVYNVLIQDIIITDLNNWYDGIGETLEFDHYGNPQPVIDFSTLPQTDTDGDGVTEAEAAGRAYIQEVFDNNDMILLGFEYSYGKNATYDGFSGGTSIMINDYIDEGRPILFSQDGVSLENVPIYNYPVSPSGASIQHHASSFSGYYFNQLIRGKTGLDTYGITDAQYGFSTYSYIRLGTETAHYLQDAGNTKAVVASGYEKANSSDINALKEAGFAIAYEPNSNRESYVGETQAYTAFALNIYNYYGGTESSGTGNYNTQKASTNGDYEHSSQYPQTADVSQVNKGQITSYPYDINFGDFKIEGSGHGETLNIARTNNQWFTANMYADDITVWYCLADEGLANSSAYANHYNDVANSYFIYNKGNVTYTGAGNRSGESSTREEAELFVNIMIAAYRSKNRDTNIEFEDYLGNVHTHHLMPTVYGEEAGTSDLILDGTTAGELPTTRELPFMIEDPNLVSATAKTHTVKFYYEIPAVEDDTGVVTVPAGATHYAVADEVTGQAEQMVPIGTLPEGVDPADITYFASLDQSALDIHEVALQPDGSLIKSPASTLTATIPYVMYFNDAVEAVLAASEENEISVYLELTSVVSKDGADEEPAISLTSELKISKLGLMQLN